MAKRGEGNRRLILVAGVGVGLILVALLWMPRRKAPDSEATAARAAAGAAGRSG